MSIPKLILMGNANKSFPFLRNRFMCLRVLIATVTTSPIGPRYKAHAYEPNLADDKEKHSKKPTIGESIRVETNTE